VKFCEWFISLNEALSLIAAFFLLLLLFIGVDPTNNSGIVSTLEASVLKGIYVDIADYSSQYLFEMACFRSLVE
jgi:hypothetical protein